MKEIKQETNRPKGNLPYQDVNRPFRMQFVVPGPGITIEQDKNGVLYISAQGGSSVSDIIAGDNIEIERREDGGVVISAVNSVANISAGENVTITVDPVTGASVINSIIGGETNEHYKGVFDTTEDLIAADPDPEIGDYGLIKSLTITNGETSWSGQYKYCFFINGAWTVVDQMLTFTKNLDLLQQYYSVGGSSPVIYLHEIARSGNFWDLNNIPIVATPEVTVEGTTVTVTCATEGAEIWYTTDGSMPHVNGTKYTGPITVSEATSFRFVGIKNGMINSLEATASADYELQAPVIELDWHTGEITMTNPNENGRDPVGVIHYTTDGSTPTASSPVYDNAFIVSGHNATIKALVIDRSKSSTVSSVFYPLIFQSGVSSTANIPLGYYEFQPVSVFVSGSEEIPDNYEIHYTLDGSDPSYLSPVMTSKIRFDYYDGRRTMRQRVFAPGHIPGNVVIIPQGAEKPPVPPIIYDADTGMVSLCDRNVDNSHGIIDDLWGGSTNGKVYFFPDALGLFSRIYYTLDGSTPTDQSTLYTGPFSISETTTVKAVLIAYGQYSSDVAALDIQVMSDPQFSLDWHTGQVAMTNPNGEGTIYYTLDGSEPTSESNVYSAPVTLTNNTTVKAKVIAETGSSATATQTFTRAQAPKINDGNVSLTYNLNILTGIYDVKMNTSQQGGVIRYTSLPGHFPDNPTWSDNQFVDELSAPFFEEWTFEARTFAEGFIPSAVVTQTFGLDSVHPVLINYDEDSATVSFHRQWFTAQIPLQTNNNTPELGCRVYYTLDGSTPDDKSTLWDGNPVSVAPGTTVKALLVCYGEYESQVATYNVPGGADYLYFEATEANSTVSMNSLLPTAPSLEYSTNGVTWQEWEYTDHEPYPGIHQHVFDTVTLGAIGDKVYFRGDNPNGLAVSQDIVSGFITTGLVNVGGNVLTLLDKTEDLTEVPDYGFTALFKGTLIAHADILGKITKIGEYGCCDMFRESALTSAPVMPSLEYVGNSGLSDTYYMCESLLSVADFPKLEIVDEWAMAGTYSLCPLITVAANLPALQTIGDWAFGGMYHESENVVLLENGELAFDFIALPYTDTGGNTFSTAQEVVDMMTSN